MRQHLGSTMTIITGFLVAIGGLNAITVSQENGLLIFAGLSLIAGGISYRSAKQRYLKNAKTSVLRLLLLEILPMFVIGFLLFGQNDFKSGLAHDPASQLLITLAGIPYLVILFRFSEPSFQWASPPRESSPITELSEPNKLISAMQKIDTRPCPYCAETIKYTALICRFCNRDVPKVIPEKPAINHEEHK